MSGEGVLKFTDVTETVAYRITGRPEDLRLDRPPLRGVLHAQPQTALAAFRAGRALLTLEDGRDYRLTVVAHTEGGDAAFFEIRV
jgi:hypothetical protein